MYRYVNIPPGEMLRVVARFRDGDPGVLEPPQLGLWFWQVILDDLVMGFVFETELCREPLWRAFFVIHQPDGVDGVALFAFDHLNGVEPCMLTGLETLVESKAVGSRIHDHGPCCPGFLAHAVTNLLQLYC